MPLTKEEKYRRHKLYKQTEHFKKIRKAYEEKRKQDPEVQLKAKLHRQTPEYKAKAYENAKKYRQSEKYKEWKKNYRKTPEQQLKRKNYEYKRKFGITFSEYEVMLRQQNYVCAICKKEESFELRGTKHSLAIDHCHKTGKIRGLLCRNCNQGLGLFHDNVEFLSQAIYYLNKDE